MLKLRGASTSERGRDFRSLENINYDFSMTHAPTPWGFSPLTWVQTSNMNISQTVKNYMACHISTETYRQVENIKIIVDPEYINLVGKNCHAILDYPLVLLGLTSMTTANQQSPPLALMAT